MTIKKVFIIVFLVLSLILLIFQPMEIKPMFDDLVEEMGGFFAYVVGFYFMSSTFLFWIGVPAGWRMAEDFLIWGKLVCCMIGMLLSLPIALFQLFKSED